MPKGLNTGITENLYWLRENLKAVITPNLAGAASVGSLH